MSAESTKIVAPTGDLDEAAAGQAVTLTLTDDVDVSRGHVLAAPDARPEVADQFSAHIIWMSEQPLVRTFESFEALLRKLYAPYTFAFAAEESGVDEEQIRRVAEEVARCEGKLAAES